VSSTWAAETWAPPVSMVISAEDKDPGVIEMEAGKERVTEAGLEVISLISIGVGWGKCEKA